MPGITLHALARTYDHPSKDPWDAVQLYETALTYPNDWGAQRVATAINTDPDTPCTGVTRAELRAWIDGDGKPDAAHAVATARRHGWTATEWTATTRALAHLVVGVYVCGSISIETSAPSWSPDDLETERILTDALKTVGCGVTYVPRATQRQGDEYRPARYASHLGRALRTAGAPVGDKNATSVDALPEWIGETPSDLKTELARLFVRGRANTYPTKATRRIQTARGQQYFSDVAQLLRDVTGESVTASTTGVTISAAAVRALDLEIDSEAHVNV